MSGVRHDIFRAAPGSGLQHLHRLRLRVEVLLWRYGTWPCWVTVMALGIAWLWYVERPAQEAQLAILMRPIDQPASVIEVDEGSEDDHQRLAAFRAVLPQRDTSTEQVRRLIDITHESLTWRQAEFMHSEDSPIGLVRVQISVPVAGTYPRLRDALDRALRELPTLAIDQIHCQRQSTSESTLQVRVRFSLFLRSDSLSVPMVAGVR